MNKFGLFHYFKRGILMTAYINTCEKYCFLLKVYLLIFISPLLQQECKSKHIKRTFERKITSKHKQNKSKATYQNMTEKYLTTTQIELLK